MANQESPIIKRLTFRLPVALWRHLGIAAKRRNMEISELLRFIINEEMLKVQLTREEISEIDKEINDLLNAAK